MADRNDNEAFEQALLSLQMKWDVVFDCICMNAEHALQDLNVLSKVAERLVVVSTDSVYHPLFKKTPQTEEGVFFEQLFLTDENMLQGRIVLFLYCILLYSVLSLSYLIVISRQ